MHKLDGTIEVLDGWQAPIEGLDPWRPDTVTDARVKRFFMTIREAVQLVLKAGAAAKGGEVFVLDMGKPVPILQLARQVIESTGYTVRDAANPEGDIEIEMIGLRPGEKIEEELTLTWVEEWRSAEDFEQHLQTPAFRKILAVMELSSVPPAMEIDDVSSRRGFDMVEEILSRVRTGGRQTSNRDVTERKGN